MSVLLTSTRGLNLTIPSSEYQVALGQDISLGCHFILDPVDVGSLAIEWTVNRSDSLVEPEHLEGRGYFSHPDPQDGDASLTIQDVKIIDNGTYHCKVKKGLEIQCRQIKLMVMEEVSVPVHGSNRGTESDVDSKLRNRSSLVTTFPANYGLLTSTETSASTQDDLSSQGNAKNTTGSTKGTTTVITTGTITGTYRDFGMVHDIAETPAVDLSLTTESQNTSSSSSTSQDRGIVDIVENMGMELEDKTLMGIKEEDSTEEAPETQNVDFEGVQVMGASLPEPEMTIL
ncbi:hypothetical protein PAMA_002761 [Pampus argenteus]